MILLIDNYDSFSYNLYQLLGGICQDLKVVRNDQITVEEIKEMKPEMVVLSPGPGRPENAGICVEVVRQLKGQIPIFGVCLGHQAICYAYGATVTYAEQLMHGKTSMANLDVTSTLFKNMEPREQVGRYHSLAVDISTLSQALKVTATTADGEVMAVEDTENKVYGVQFHPESVLTPTGIHMMKNLVGGIRS